MADLKLASIKPWAPHRQAAPVTERPGDALSVASNGTRTCVGGWQLEFSDAVAGEAYSVCWDIDYEGIARPADMLECLAYWGEISRDSSRRRDSAIASWSYLLPERTGPRHLRFSRVLKVPEGVDRLTLRCTFRWSAEGKAVWQLPRIESVPRPASPAPVKIAVATGRAGSRRRRFTCIQDNLDFYVPLCEAACQHAPNLIVLPEIALQDGIPGSALDRAVPAPGPETDVFAELCRKHGVRILLGMLERNGDAVHNSAVLMAPDGGIDGKYRKVHLAVGNEMDSGILPGDGFPVFQTEIGRVGCNICMDTSAAESSRMVGLNGADFLLMPIMGDFRAHHPEAHVFDPDRFRAIMQTHAMDNQVCMVVSVNRAEGSCIVDRLGNVLAWNDGGQDMIQAEVALDDGLRPANRGCARAVTWMLRRPHVYSAFVDPDNKGHLPETAY